MTHEAKEKFNSLLINHTSTESHKECKEFEIDVSESKKKLNFTINVFGIRKLSICKPLIILKIILFLYYGTGAFFRAFSVVYLKQRGITLTELSSAFFIIPFIQNIWTICCGIIADKIGKVKPVLMINLTLFIICLATLLLLPPLWLHDCDFETKNVTCFTKQLNNNNTNVNCAIMENKLIDSFYCIHCNENSTNGCLKHKILCKVEAEKENNVSLLMYLNASNQMKKQCITEIDYVSHINETYQLCNLPHKLDCQNSCDLSFKHNCLKPVKYRNIFMVIIIMLYILILVVLSCIFRCLDIMVMFLVKEHDSDFGRERFFGITGVLVLSPIAGYLVRATSTTNEKRYNSALYLGIGILVLVLLFVMKLNVKENKPGNKMKKKTIILLKNPDVLVFGMVVLVLGTGFSFLKNFLFWYMEDLKATSMLIGLIPAMSSLYGLPFLITSDWWVAKIGTRGIFLLAFLGYVVNSVGYSFIVNPWLALILEATNIFTYHLLWVAVVRYSFEIAPEGLRASIISLAGSIHYNTGRLTGSMIGGLIMDVFGGKMAFRVLGIICLCSAIFYALYLFVRQKYFTKK